MSLIVYGARCVWWDSIDKAATLPNGIPCCPHCKGVLFQMEETIWNESVKKFEGTTYPGYVAFITWLRGKCYNTQQVAEMNFATSLKET